MFVQMITGRVSDPGQLEDRMDTWMRDLAPGAQGWLGATGGQSSQGPYWTVVRFESEEAARANSDRPEQGEWWKATEAAYDGPVSFIDSADVGTFLGGGSDDAGFVQIMRMSISDRSRYEEIEKQLEETAPLADARPEIIGGLLVWESDARAIAVNYFTSEEEARQGESKDPPADIAGLLEEWRSLMSDVEWFDLRDPKMWSS